MYRRNRKKNKQSCKTTTNENLFISPEYSLFQNNYVKSKLCLPSDRKSSPRGSLEKLLNTKYIGKGTCALFFSQTAVLCNSGCETDGLFLIL